MVEIRIPRIENINVSLENFGVKIKTHFFSVGVGGLEISLIKDFNPTVVEKSQR